LQSGFSSCIAYGNERREIELKYSKIQKMAKNMGINTYQMKKNDVILAIQRAENNIECFGTVRVDYCQELSCLWREDCVSLNKSNQSSRS
jgi:hypothetical protein